MNSDINRIASTEYSQEWKLTKNNFKLVVKTLLVFVIHYITMLSVPSCSRSVQSNDDTASGHLSYPELRQRIFDHTHPNKKVELEPDSRCSRSQSTNDISKVRIGRQASVTINRRIT